MPFLLPLECEVPPTWDCHTNGVFYTIRSITFYQYTGVLDLTLQSGAHIQLEPRGAYWTEIRVYLESDTFFKASKTLR